jgi:geranylgeranyl diphosphate synthase type II
MTFLERLEQERAEIDAALEYWLPSEATPPVSVHQAMRYSVFAGGKRIRPILCLRAGRLFGAEDAAVLPVACALELIHTYSLIHDDLPALDNDSLRRGKPTCHVQFGEALAILAGDGLLTLAFHVLARAPVEAERRVRIIEEISAAAGTVNGMVGGQVADLEAGGQVVTAGQLEYIHRSKTAALIRAAAVAGGLAGQATAEDLERLRQFGEKIGWAFQVVDDILDVEESSVQLGKTAGKDEQQKKATYPALFGLEPSRQFAQALCQQAVAELDVYGERADSLRELAHFLVRRRM